jgi:hypothetical protein
MFCVENDYRNLRHESSVNAEQQSPHERVKLTM